MSGVKPNPDEEMEHILRQTLRFLDLSRDLDRNRDDTEFAANGGTIFYVLDENLFEIFVRPQDARGQSVSLHARSWLDDANAKDMTAYAAQSALLTTEYVLSGELPGQWDTRLFMTEWHRWELARRTQTLGAELGEALSGVDYVSLFDRIAQPDREPSDLTLGNAHLDPILKSDFEHFRPLLGQSRVRDGFVATRLAVGLLAADSTLEPAEQVVRLVTAPIRQRLSTLHLTFKPSDMERNGIAREARIWFRALTEQAERQGSHEHGRGRPAAALWDDAKSLALIRWAAVCKVRPNQRIVFITADAMLFDVYREWYAKLNPADPEYGEPFCLRRLRQYAPIFNLSDARNALGKDVKRFFEQLQNTVEVTLLPLNVSRLGRSRDDQIITRMRELTALRGNDRTPIHTDLAYSSLVRAFRSVNLPRHRDSFDNIIQEWRRLERTAIGLATEYVRRRLDERDRKVQDIMEQTNSADARKAFNVYVSDLVGSIQSGSVALWLPLAREAIEAWKPATNGQATRAPIAFRFEIDLGEKPFAFDQAFDSQWKDKGSGPLIPQNAWPELLQRPELVFAIAACLALASEDWSDAQHFADMAWRADQANLADRPAEDSARKARRSNELRYLNALTKRFRIGSMAPPLNADTLARIRREYDGAAALLSDCITFYDQPGAGSWQLLHLIRAMSERAALDLFKVAALTPVVREKAQSRRMGRQRSRPADGQFPSQIEPALLPEGLDARILPELTAEAWAALRRAEADLRNCYDRAAVLASNLDPDSVEFLRKLRRQFVPNIAASVVIRGLLSGGRSEVSRSAKAEAGLDPRNVTLRHEISELLDGLEAGSRSLLQSELLGFLWICGDRTAASRLAAIQPPKPGGHTLTLDLALSDAIKDMVNTSYF